MKILIVRNDKLGDFILSFPVFRILKDNINNVELHALVPEYTSQIAKLNTDIDSIILDPGKDAPFAEQVSLIKTIRTEKYDAIITLYSTTRIGLVALLSDIAFRLAPATKIAQIFYNQRLEQRRSRSLKPEYQYNLDLALHFLQQINIQPDIKLTGPYLVFSKDEIIKVHESFFEGEQNNKFIMIHPGTGGSATNLSLNQYANLAVKLDNKYSIVISAGPGEAENAKQLAGMIRDKDCLVYDSKNGLVEFSKLIASADLFISASTGPLHIAGALDIPTAAFYQRRRSATALRWQTLNSENRRLAFVPPESEHESDLTKIDITAAAKEINRTYFS